MPNHYHFLFRPFVQQYFPLPTDYEAFISATLDEKLEQRLQGYYLD